MECEIVSGPQGYETTEAQERVVLDRAGFLNAARNFRRELVEVPEFGGRVWVREFTVSECDRFGDLSARIEAEKDAKRRDLLVRNRMALVVAWCACDENGSPMFNEDDIEAIGGSPYVAANRIAEAAIRLSGFGSIMDTVSEAQGN